MIPLYPLGDGLNEQEVVVQNENASLTNEEALMWRFVRGAGVKDKASVAGGEGGRGVAVGDEAAAEVAVGGLVREPAGDVQPVPAALHDGDDPGGHQRFPLPLLNRPGG